MNDKNFSTVILVSKTPAEVFNAVNNVRGWWSENIEGHTDQLNAEFLYHYKDVHISKMKIVEFVPDKKVAWLVLENQFNFTNEQSEWKGNKIVFEISGKNDQTQLQFTQFGLTPAYECYNVCRDAWSNYIQVSLKDLITTGKGKPNTKENDSLNKQLIEKWGLLNKEKNTTMQNKNYSATYLVEQSPKEIFDAILDVRKWWSGLYSEEIKGSSEKLNDEFTFRAGGGLHYSKQKLVELIPGKKIVWLVTESNLDFLNKKDEWTGTKLCFEILKQAGKTEVTFTHLGLIPSIECYHECSGAWSSYLNKFLLPLQEKSKAVLNKKN